jgi:mono/diheme cytochrome c family protein
VNYRVARPKGARARRGVSGCVAALVILGLGCQGRLSAKPPLRFTRDMANQAKVLPLSASSQHARVPIGGTSLAGTLALEQAYDDERSNTGKSATGYLVRLPFEVDSRVLARGEARFNVYCSPCHDRAGSARGLVALRGFPGPIELSSEATRKRPDGELFWIIGNGIRNMPNLQEQVAVSDRWDIVAWVRVLQRSQHATPADVSAAKLADVLPERELP